MAVSAVAKGINFAELGARLSGVKSSASSSSHQRSGLLLVLDLHGLLVERIANQEWSKRREAQTLCNYAFTQKNHFVWTRPHVETFLEFAYCRHDIAVWSSAQPHTITGLLNGLSDHFEMRPSLRSRLQFVWDRSKCRLDPDSGPYATLKHMHDFWDFPGFDDRYSSKNTLLLDDSETKLRHCPLSGLLVPEYKAGILGERYSRDDTLLWVLLYVEYLLTEANLVSPEPGTMDIASIREQCISLEDFILAGELEARKSTSKKESNENQSLAWAFVPDLDEETVSSLREECLPNMSVPAPVSPSSPASSST